MTKRILLVNSDELLRHSLAEQLMGQGMSVIEAISAATALSCSTAEAIDLMVIDAAVSGMSAPALCATLRDEGFVRPIVILGAKADDIPALLDAGANECIAKPFRFANLMARLQGLLRPASGDPAMPIGSYRFHPLARLVVDPAGRPIHLTEKETAILSYLHRAGSRVVPRDELLGEVWGYASTATTHTVETHIYRLRRKLEDADGPKAVLVTVGGGYRLAGPA